jgi:FlgN protein.
METVESASKNLLITMNQMLSLLENLIESAKKKESLVSADSIEDLEELLADEAETSNALKKKENDLKCKADNLRRAVGIPNKITQIKEICGFVKDDGCREQLSAARAEMVEAIGRLNRQNAKIKKLLRFKIGYADYMLNLLRFPQSRLSSYDGQGAKLEGVDDYGLFDCHV